MATVRRRDRPGDHEHPLHDLRPRRAGRLDRPEGARADLSQARLGRARPGRDLERAPRRSIGEALTSAGIDKDDLAAIGITNQRETAVVWDRTTGEAVHNAIVWQDTRTDEICDELMADGGQDRFRRQDRPADRHLLLRPEGPLDPRQRRRRRRRAPSAGDLLFGNMDTWVIWNLTGGTDGGLHITDVTNASRTHADGPGDAGLGRRAARRASASRGRCCPRSSGSSEVYGEAALAAGRGRPGRRRPRRPAGGPLRPDLLRRRRGQEHLRHRQLPAAQHRHRGRARRRTASSRRSATGSATSRPVYALEGSIAITGALVQWLRDNLKLIKAAPEVEELAMTVEDNGGVYFVPAFSGLFAPYWRSDARGVIAGLTRYVNAGHIARATLEATAYQSREVVEAMNADSGRRRSSRSRWTAAWCSNDLLMQFQADMLDVHVIRPAVAETTALGRRLRGRPRGRLLAGAGGPARELGRGQALDADDGRRAARDASTATGRRRSPSRSTGSRRRATASPRTLECDVLVIGGGATGLGVVRDAAMRGFRSILVERVDLGQGTTGRFHGLLHSGGRYVVSDPRSATECAEENADPPPHRRRGDRGHRRPLRHDPGRRPRLRRPLPGRLPRDRRAGAGDPGRRGARARAALNPGISRAFEVQDASVDAWKLLWGNAALGARARRRRSSPTTGSPRSCATATGWSGAVARDDRGGGEVRIEAGFTINAGGVWAGEIADMADCPGVTVVPGKGIMIAMNHRLVRTVVNRCEPPGDGDILVPIRTVCVIGTTDVQGRQPRRPRHRPRRGAADARRRRGHRAGLPPGAGPARLDRVAAAVQGRARRRGRAGHPPHEPRPGAGGPPARATA